MGENVPIESYVRMTMFAIVFFLSMDYEVSLVSPLSESWDAIRDHAGSVARGLSATGRVITCAALIMVGVFLAIVGSTQVVVTMLAVGLGSSALIGATVVRLVLAPAVIYLVGERRW